MASSPAKCGAKRIKVDQPCQRPAGWGTDHPGIGRCKRHGGATPTHNIAANKHIARQAVATYGLPVEVDPRDALLQEVHRTAGHVTWLQQLVAALEHGGTGYRQEQDPDGDTILVPLTGLKQMSRDGKFEKPSVWVELYQQERRHLREVSRDAIAAGIEERRVQLAEQYGALLSGAVRGILGDLNLTSEQWAQVAEIVPRHLRAVASAAEG